MKRALIVIDVQREYFDGAFPIRHPVGHLENILQVMDQAQQAKIPTVVPRPTMISRQATIKPEKG